MKNRLSWKLLACFAIALVLFSLVTGSIFIVLFRQHIINQHQRDLAKNANNIATTLSEFYYVQQELLLNNDRPTGMGRSGNGMGGYGAYLRFLDDLSIADVWIVDENRQLITHTNYKYESIPENAEHIINRVFDGETTFGEEFSSFLSVPVLTVGAPVILADGKVVAAVLLHTPVDGVGQIVNQGLSTLTISILVSLILVFLLSVWLSSSLAKPLEKVNRAAAEISNGKYNVKTGVQQQDEIGQLAQTIDILAVHLENASYESMRLEQMRQNLIATVSHELRTPVTVLRGSLEALCDGIISTPQELEQYYEQMLSESLYLERLVNDLLELSRLQNIDFNIEMSPVNLCDIISDVTRGMRRVAQKKNISIQVDCPIQECWFFGDYGRLRQMLLIVLDNAIKFSSVNESVEVRLSRSGNRTALIGVSDSGCGISEEELPYIFDRFHKTRSENNRSGSGLGLAIAKQIAQRHNISILVNSQPCEKTEFIFHFEENQRPTSTL